jgi:hypothetical protein
MSASARRQSARAEPEKGANNVQKHMKFGARTLRVSSHELGMFNRCRGRGCADLP